MKRLLLLLLFLPAVASAQRDSMVVMFWNVENFFDWRSGNGPQGWSATRFYRKCNAVAKTIFKVADEVGRPPDAIGFAEVENAYVMRELVLSTTLRKMGYKIIHFDSPDHRGIDCALLYRRSSLSLLAAEPKHLRDSSGAVMATRDILTVQFVTAGGDSLAVLVNHHPSQIGGKSAGRLTAMSRLTSLTDSLVHTGCRRVLAIGDFNEDKWHDGSSGTIKYNGAWEKIDGHFATGFTKVTERIFDDTCLSEADKSGGGIKPRRTFIGPRYNGGISDHYPIVVTVYF